MRKSRSIQEQVAKQVRRWEVEQRAKLKAPPARCVAISRLPGSRGAEVGERVAVRLDYGLFDRELLNQIEREHGIERRLLEGLDERVRSVIDRYVADAFRHRAFAESDYLERVVRCVTTLGERGRAVIVGRGAPFILSRERALRVLVVAPRSFRIERVAAERSLSRDRAEELLARADAERSEFLRRSFAVVPEDPTLYDLIVNTGTLGVDGAAALVVEALALQ